MITKPATAGRLSRAWRSLAMLAAILACALPLSAAFAADAPWVGDTLDGQICEGEGQGYGPYDYTNPEHVANHLPIVERAHFTPKVSSLAGGRKGSLLGDLDYTLRAFPNHHRALYAIIRLAGQERGRLMLDRWRTPPECYLQRAIYFTPDDHQLYVLFGIYLHQREHYGQAVEMYQRALEMSPGLAEAHYNLGLALLERSAFEQARQHAREAYDRGFPLPGLRERLSAAGYPP